MRKLVYLRRRPVHPLTCGQRPGSQGFQLHDETRCAAIFAIICLGDLLFELHEYAILYSIILPFCSSHPVLLLIGVPLRLQPSTPEPLSFSGGFSTSPLSLLSSTMPGCASPGSDSTKACAPRAFHVRYYPSRVNLCRTLLGLVWSGVYCLQVSYLLIG